VDGDLVILSDGEMAIQFIHDLDTQTTGCPNLIIIDLNLPKRSGREVLAAMRSSERCGRVPAMILSSSDTQQDRADADRLGANRYLRKPTQLEDFLSLGAIFKTALMNPAR